VAEPRRRKCATIVIELYMYALHREKEPTLSARMNHNGDSIDIAFAHHSRVYDRVYHAWASERKNNLQNVKKK